MTIFLQKHTSTKGRHFKKELFAHFCPTCFPKNVGQKCANFWSHMALSSNSFVKWRPIVEVCFEVGIFVEKLSLV